jgi:diguanylate cyclase (GGDEF)-like protein/PAS domain S-box-containing protein
MSDAALSPPSAMELLEAEYESLLSFLYICPVGVIQTAGDGTVRLINPCAAQLLIPIVPLLAISNLFEALHGCAPELRNLAEAFTPSRGQICRNHRIFLSGSAPGPRVLSCSLLKVDPESLVAVLQDVSQQVEQEHQLKQNEALFAALVTGVNDFALFSLDVEGAIDSWNVSGVRQTGFDSGAVLGRKLEILCDPAGSPAQRAAEQVAAAAPEGWSLYEARCLRRDGGRYWCQILIAAKEGENGAIDGYSVVLRDITERRVTGDDLRRLLTTDNLTGAANRAYFFERAEAHFARSGRTQRPLSAIMFDVDHFKRVNDSYGHAAGDSLLRALVTSCRACLGEDDILARLGGEEFAVLLPDANLKSASQVAEQMRLAVAADLATLGDLPVKATISLGCAELHPQLDGVDALLRAADEAMYRAKRAGRNQVMLAPPPRATAIAAA